ncbi:MAG: hypothetical protein RJB60_1589 [Pseudomonadota bacterium]|jgi:hypothetical protein
MKRSTLCLALLAATVISLPAMAQSAKDFEELRNEVLRLRQEINEMKGQKAAPAPAAEAAKHTPAEHAAMVERVEQLELRQKDAVVAGDIPGSFRLPGSETSIKLYGYAELNAIHEFKGDNSFNDYSTFLPYAPINGRTVRKGQTVIHARTSRLGVESSTPTSFGPLGIKLEGDFNNEPRADFDVGVSGAGASKESILTQQATNSYGFRLRHAYATFAGFTIGQTWSTFMDVDNSPETVDFNGPIGSTFLRQGLIRYTYNSPDVGGLTVAIENPVSYAYDSGGYVISAGLSKSPDLVARWDKSFDWGNLSVRGVTQEVRISRDAGEDKDKNSISEFKASKRGYGFGSTAFIKTRGGQDFLSLGVTYGDGVGRYFNYIEGAIADEANNRILMERAIGVVMGYQYKASDMLRSNVVLGWQQNFSNGYTDFAKANGLDSGQYGINKSLYQLHTGLIYTPVKGVDLGAEYIFGRRKTLNGERGDLSRMNFMARYTFN